MLFNSSEFLIFLPTLLLLYYLMPHKYRWLLLLLASYIFYMAWEWKYLSLILFSTVLDYFVARRMSNTEVQSDRKMYLWISLCANLGMLIFFKYANFFVDNINPLLDGLGLDYLIPYTSFLLPMGISFYTFQTMAYTIDVYYKRVQVERHFGYFALYVSYFPQLVAGPIERAQNLLQQLRKKHHFSAEAMILGTKLLIWGLFKKMVIADRLGVFVSQIYDNPHELSGMLVILATLFFALQIYCDFSGYTDIAIGVAAMFGVKLMDNFRTPYFSKSITEFWGRWHISLSTWFRDYLYIPLGGNRVSKSRWVLNILLVFTVSGFWHGANWTFIIWGALHGAYLLIERFLPNVQMPKVFRQMLTFSLVCFAWLFFRSADLGHSLALIAEMKHLGLDAALSEIAEFGSGKMFFLLILAVLFTMVDARIDSRHKREQRHQWDFALYAFILVSILLFGNFGEVSFIYFQF